MKGQDVRLVDVFVLGPFMVWYATQESEAPPWARLALAAAGVATIVYNGRNWIEADR